MKDRFPKNSRKKVPDPFFTLALETATPVGSVSLIDGAGQGIEADLAQRSNHSRTLLPTVSVLLTQAGLTPQDLGLIVADIGPGSFTGLRIGLSAAKGLAWALNKPLVGVHSLDVLAERLPRTYGLYCPVLDARKGEVYTALYRVGPDKTGRLKTERLTELLLLRPEALAGFIQEKTVFVGDGLVNYGGLLEKALGPLYRRGDEDLDFPGASAAARLGLARFAAGAESDPALILPVYIRPSEAELSLTGGKAPERV